MCEFDCDWVGGEGRPVLIADVVNVVGLVVNAVGLVVNAAGDTIGLGPVGANVPDVGVPVPLATEAGEATSCGVGENPVDDGGGVG